jgi:dephospho-CoA kinase
MEMNNIDYNLILDRKTIVEDIKKILNSYDENIKCQFKKGIYICGSPGCGKTFFINNILKELNYSCIKYDSGDIRNKNLINNMTANSNKYVLDTLKKKIVIVMDEIDAMISDKSSLTALIKLIRQKKTKKQKLENSIISPIIFIGNNLVDKKIQELMNVCYIFELSRPNYLQMSKLIINKMPNLSCDIVDKIINYINGDLSKMNILNKIYCKRPLILTELFMFKEKNVNEEPKKITKMLFENNYNINYHNLLINDNDRTIISLLWHENIINIINKKKNANMFYLKILENICYADYIDRITFQNQIWIFNEMSSLIKTFHNNKIYHDTYNSKPVSTIIRFTKVLTKYSTEYNNFIFIFNLCQSNDMNIKDLICFFQEVRIKNDIKLDTFFNKLDIKRMYRYLDCYKETLDTDESDNEILTSGSVFDLNPHDS